MNQPNPNLLVRSEQSIKISSLSIDKDELWGFCNKLQDRTIEASDLEIIHYAQGNLTDDQWNTNKKLIRENYALRISLNGTNGEYLWGPIDEVFNSPNFPDSVSSIFIDSSTQLKSTFNFFQRNEFILFLDFSKPRIFDFSIIPSHATPNESNLKVRGRDTSWVNGILMESRSFFSSRSSLLSFVHGQIIYDLLLWLIAMPMAFRVCFKATPTIIGHAPGHSQFIASALYVYIFIIICLAFRFIFHYIRWVCPLIEFKARRSRILVHRVFLSAILVGVLGSFFYDIFKAL